MLRYRKIERQERSDHGDRGKNILWGDVTAIVAGFEDGGFFVGRSGCVSVYHPTIR
jgi:hypothetical protein